MKMQRSISKTFKALIVCILMTLAFYAGYTSANNGSGTFTISSGIYSGAPSYTIYREDSIYYAKDAYGAIVYSGTNFTSLYKNVESDLPYGGKIFLKAGYYEGTIVIERNGITIEGEGSYFDVPPQWQQPSALYGTVIKPPGSANGILISGANRSGIVIKNLGIWFASSPTGDGITTDGGDYFNVEDLLIERVNVLNHDGDRFAINLENFLETTVRHVDSAGGGLLRLYANWDNFHAGDAVFQNMYARIAKTMSANGDAARGFPFIIARNGTRGDCWVNDVVFDSILMNCPTTQPSSNYYGVVLWFARSMVFNHLHYEGVDTGYTYQWVNIGACHSITFNSPYFWTFDKGYLGAQHTNYKITWINPVFAGSQSVIADGNQTDIYINPAIYGNIDSNTNAGFIGLEGNSGIATLPAGASSTLISARFISQYDYVMITIIDDDVLQAGEALKVSAINVAPTNTFTVQCIDEGTASVAVTFYWQVVHKC